MTADPGTVVDFSTHLYPDEVFPDPDWDSVAAMKNDYRDIVDPLLTDPEAFHDRYRAAGVDVAVLSSPYYMGHHDADRTARANDALMDVVTDYDMFRGLAGIPVPAGGEAAAAEFERSLEAGFHGGALETKSRGVELVDADLEPVFEVAEAYDAPILVHPKLNDSLSPDVLSDEWRLNATFGREVALSESVAKVVHQGVLDRFPDLNLVYHHLGGNLPAMLGRVHLQLAEGRIPSGPHLKNSREFLHQLEERVYLDTSGFFNHSLPLRAALEKMPATRIVFGTDFPFEHRSADEIATGPDLLSDLASRTDAKRVLAENALDLLYEP